MTDTPLDRAHVAMSQEPDNDALRLRFFERLADAELFLLLETEAEGDDITPVTFDSQGETMVVLFDTEARLADFAGEAPFVALSGRAVLGVLTEAGLGLALNPEVAVSSFVLDGAGVRWLAERLDTRPEEAETRVAAFVAPSDLPQVLFDALDQKLAAMGGLAELAYLVGTRSEEGGAGHMLAFVGVEPGAEPALAQAVSEALIFSGVEAAALDVSCLDANHPALARLERVGLRFDLPDPHAPLRRSAPGRNPDQPPRLK